MSGWLARDSYSPLAVIGTGLLTYAGALGVGRLALRLAGVSLSSTWSVVVGVLLGVQVLSLSVQLLGMTSVASPGVLIALAILVWLPGLPEIGRAVRAIRGGRRAPVMDSSFARALLVIIAVTLTVNLVIAAAPSTKADEIYYHMLVPSRIVHDGALRFYLLPWEGAWLPHMAFQIASAPLHALGVPDAFNVVSWALSVTMVCFCYRIAREAGQSVSWAAFWSAAIIVGLYGAVWHVTGGAHVMGELAIAALLVVILRPESLGPRLDERSYAITVGILATAAAMSKLSTLPIAAILFALGVAQRGGSVRQLARRSATAALPVLVLGGPVFLWSWAQSGSPFGPYLSWWFPHSAYSALPVRGLFTDVSNTGLLGVRLTETVSGHSPLLLAGMLGVFLASALDARRRLLAAALLLVQSAVIVGFLIWDPRYLAGLPVGLVMVFAVAPDARVLNWMRAPALKFASIVLLVPWLVLQLYYAQPFASVTLGVRSSEQFRERYVSYNADYRALDALLPRNAFLRADERISAVYAPRPPVWTVLDAPPGAPVYQFAASCTSLEPGMAVSETVYVNRVAKATPYRAPGSETLLAPLCVGRLRPLASGPDAP